MGLTRSSSTKKDRRKRKVTLTEKGLEQLEKIVTIRGILFSQATSCLTKEQAKELRLFLIQLENHLTNVIGITFDVKHKDMIF
jgi:DNA-binding MarR family transcriptional regulator